MKFHVRYSKLGLHILLKKFFLFDIKVLVGNNGVQNNFSKLSGNQRPMGHNGLPE